MYKRPETRSVVIAINESLSGAFSIGDYMKLSILTPSAWTAADLTFQGCATLDGTFVDIYNSDDAELNVDAAASRGVGLTSAETDILGGFQFLKIRSGTAATPVNQAAARTITVVLK